MERTILDDTSVYQMKIYKQADELLRDEQLKNVKAEIVDGVLVIHYGDNVNVIFHTGVMVKFKKPERV